MSDAAGSAAIDEIIDGLGDWRGETLTRLRVLIKDAVPGVTETTKWKKKTNPLGVPTWEREGVICTGESYKDKVKLTFPKGSKMDDPDGLFNASLDAKARRVIDLAEGDELDPEAFKRLVGEAAERNSA